MVKTHRFQQDRCESQGEFVMIEKKNRTVVVWLLGEGECGGGESRSSSTGREGKWVCREGAVRVAEEKKAVIFCGREEVKPAEGCGEGECGGGECRSSWVRREGCREGCRGEGFFADEKLIKAAFG
ncbi:hypothetical protein DKX38_013103 [Salix brachista]|uniref:Uncharacterized protein n=1 Tax=Salix brachista TaxID=2182728 RepID=A0A5N5LS59_9ROSI|nr:hypothetical protein DKX38_013103 [Salix brachista]